MSAHSYVYALYMRRAHARMSHTLASCIRMSITFASRHIYIYVCAAHVCVCVCMYVHHIHITSHHIYMCVCVCVLNHVSPHIHAPSCPHCIYSTLLLGSIHHWMLPHLICDIVGIYLTHAHAHIHTLNLERPHASSFLHVFRLNFLVRPHPTSLMWLQASLTPRTYDSPIFHFMLPLWVYL